MAVQYRTLFVPDANSRRRIVLVPGTLTGDLRLGDGRPVWAQY
jgi:hypothetical protein